MSTTTTHTPGPWTVQHFDDEPTACICAGEGDIRLTTMESLGPKQADDAEHDANARLIAAAPEMLANHKTELIWLRHIATRVTSPTSVLLGIERAIKTHEAIIAKAEGAAYRNKNNVPYWSSPRD